jgi:hypothetical protein
MASHPKPAFDFIEVAGIACIVVSVTLIAYVLFFMK